MSIRILALAFLTCLGSCLPAIAAEILYTYSNDTAYGYLNSSCVLAFDYTVQAVADPSQVSIAPVAGGNLYSVSAQSTTVTLTAENGGPLLESPTCGIGLLTVLSAGPEVLTVTTPVTVTYDSADETAGIDGVVAPLLLFTGLGGGAPVSNAAQIANWNLATPLTASYTPPWAPESERKQIWAR